MPWLQAKSLPPAKDIGEMSQIIFNDQINAGLTALFLAVVVIVAVYGLRTAMKARKVGWPTAKENSGSVP